MEQIKRSLWKRFVTIAQPYFFPDIHGGGWAMLLLMFMLLAFLFGVLFLIVSGMTFAGNHFAPALTAKIADGLFSIIAGIFNSKAWLIIAGLLYRQLFHQCPGTKKSGSGLSLCRCLFLRLHVT